MAPNHHHSVPSASSSRHKNKQDDSKDKLHHRTITVAQSIDTVQMLLHASISSLSWLRSLFSDKCFETRIFDDNAPLQSYSQYLSSPPVEHDLTRSSKRTGTPMRHLCRGKSNTADQFLDQLENGAFDAIRRGYLKALQLRVFADEQRPDCVLETYTFTIDYGKDGSSPSISAVEIGVPGKKGYSVSTVKQAYTAFMRAVLDYTQLLPHLPDVRFLDTYLFFTQACDSSYQPADFEATVPGGMTFPYTRDWAVNTRDVRGFNTGYHSVDFVLTHLVSTATTREAANMPIPPDLPYEIQYPAWVDILSTQETVAIDLDLDSTPAEEIVAQELPPVQHETHSVAIPCSLPITDHALGCNLVLEQDNQAVDTFELGVTGAQHQTSCQLTAKRRLYDMQQDGLQPSKSKLTQTFQAIPPAAQPQPDAPSSVNMKQLQYSQKTITDLQRRRQSRSVMGPRITRADSQHTTSGEVIRCSCHSKTDDENMIGCDQCGTWQHAECYGYLSSTDERLPESHTCYPCLLQGKERPLLKKLEGLALQRRAIDIVEAVGWYSNEDLSSRIGCKEITAAQLTDELRRRGFLIDRAAAKKRPSSTGPKAVINRDKRVYEQMLDEFFDPATGIAHHLCLPVDPCTSQDSTGMNYVSGTSVMAPAAAMTHSGLTSQETCGMPETPSCNPRSRSKRTAPVDAMSAARQSLSSFQGTRHKRMRTSRAKNYLRVTMSS